MKSLIGDRKSLVEKKTNASREERNRQNDEVKRWVETRKGIQDTVRKLMDEMDRQQEIREAENKKVRDLKVIREEKTKAMQKIRTELFEHIDTNRIQQRSKTRGVSSIKKEMYELELKHQTGQITDKKFNERAQELRRLKKEAEDQKNSDSGGPTEIRERLKIAEAEQDAAHADVDAAAVVAQSAHDLMHEIRTEVSRLKDEHSDAHRKVEKFRRVADKHHKKFLVGMRCIQSIDGILNSSTDEVDYGEDSASVEARDLMDLLMSGETLGLDDLMAFQRNN
ncbi:MAG: hypothetical protein VXX50_00250 [Candidatus Thermoplasmatota archaeon]|nr:hypothetical protein [Candidatus Thermoplasmatota archaeon]